jgi:hypothetical protein
MGKKTVRRPSPAMVVSMIALFVALSGSAVALQGRNSVDSGDIKKNAVRSTDIKSPNGVRSNDVKNETLKGVDIGVGQVASADITDQSVTGTDIENGSVGSADITDESLTPADLGANSVERSEIASAAVGADEVGDNIAPRFNTVSVAGGAAENGAAVLGETTASCLAGEDLVSGNGWWLDDANPGGGEELYISEVVVNNGGENVSVQGANDSGTARILVAQANCLI